MKKTLLVFACFLCAGCVMTAVPPSSKPVYQFTSSTQIAPGMTQKAVMALMGDKVIIGYEKSKTGGEFVPITLNNPYRSETLSGNGKTFEAAFYITAIQNADGIISDDELTPLVFENGVLTGQGWLYLNKIKQRYALQP